MKTKPTAHTSLSTAHFAQVAEDRGCVARELQARKSLHVSSEEPWHKRCEIPTRMCENIRNSSRRVWENCIFKVPLKLGWVSTWLFF